MARFFDETSAEADCGTTIAKAELAIRTMLSAPATEEGIAMNLAKRTSMRFPEKLDFAAGDNICSHDSHLKVSRGEKSKRGGEMPVNTLHASFFQRFNQLLLIQPTTNAK